MPTYVNFVVLLAHEKIVAKMSSVHSKWNATVWCMILEALWVAHWRQMFTSRRKRRRRRSSSRRNILTENLFILMATVCGNYKHQWHISSVCICDLYFIFYFYFPSGVDNFFSLQLKMQWPRMSILCCHRHIFWSLYILSHADDDF